MTGSTVVRATRSALDGLRTSNTARIALLGGVLVVAVLAGLYAVFAQEIDRGGAVGLALPEVLLNVYVTGFRYGFVLPVLLGIHVVGGDLREGTFLIGLVQTPRRPALLAVKAAAAVLAGLGTGAVLLVTTVAIGALAATIQGVPRRLLSGEVPVTLLSAWCATPLLAVLGVGVGALFRRELTAVIVALVWLLLVDSVVAGVLAQVPGAGALPGLLPGTLVAGLSGSGTVSPGTEPVAAWAALLALAGYASVAWAAGLSVVIRRDYSTGRDR